MKTAEEIAKELNTQITERCGQIIYFNRNLEAIFKDFEKEIREDERENRIKELNSIGEFKTGKEAQEYCRLHGLDIHTTKGNVFRIAGALMDARKDQGKIIRHACAEIVMQSPGMEPNGYVDPLECRNAIMNVKNNMKREND